MIVYNAFGAPLTIQVSELNEYLEAGYTTSPPTSQPASVPSGFSIGIGEATVLSSRRSKSPFARKPVVEFDETRPLAAKEGFTFGCDPECFVKDPKGRYVAADMIPGTKAHPYSVDCGAVQRDGFAAEFNIEPAKTFTEFDRNIKKVIQQLKGFLPRGYSLDFIPAVRFDKEVFDAAADDIKELGCTPDYNAWTGDVNPPPVLPEDPYLRTASGHLHIGFPHADKIDPSSLQHILNCQDLVKQFDWYLGAWSLSQDPDPTRRQLYGKAGACRYKPYGPEYRVLSNFWVNDKAKRLAVWNRMQLAIEDMANAAIPERISPEVNEYLQKSINESALQPIVSDYGYYPIQTLNRHQSRI